MSDKAVLLETWGRAHFDPPPSLYTLAGMARKGRILPQPVKRGGQWYVDVDARVSPEPPPPIRRGRDLKDRTALYRHFAADGTLLYVGISISAVSRLSQHRVGSRWFPQIARIDVVHFPTRAEAEAAEMAAIATERPVHNRIGKR